MRRHQPRAPKPSVAEPRPALLAAVVSFVRTARDYPGVLRIALLGSLATDKPIPKDADVLVTIEGSMDLTKLARAGRQLKGPRTPSTSAPTSSSPTRPDAISVARASQRRPSRA